MRSLSPPAAADDGSQGGPALRRATLVLSATQLISWGVWFYAFPLAAPAITASAGWSPLVLSLAFSSALLVGNFIFGGDSCTQVIGLRTRGVEIEDVHQPRLITGDEQAGIMDRFWRSTVCLADR